jgi:hypothetical protein
LPEEGAGGSAGQRARELAARPRRLGGLGWSQAEATAWWRGHAIARQEERAVGGQHTPPGTLTVDIMRHA